MGRVSELGFDSGRTVQTGGGNRRAVRMREGEFNYIWIGRTMEEKKIEGLAGHEFDVQGWGILMPGCKLEMLTGRQGATSKVESSEGGVAGRWSGAERQG